MKKSPNKSDSYPEIELKMNVLLNAHQKLWELTFKLDKDILILNEVMANLLTEYKSIRAFEQQFIKSYHKKQDNPEPPKNKYPFGD